MSKSKIEWTDETWNVTTGCTRVSEGCDNCYAVTMTKRLANIGHTEEKYGGLVNEGKDHFNGTVKTHPEALEDAFDIPDGKKVFVNSMSDLFHPEVPFEFIDKVFAVMALNPKNIFQVLTKRPERMAEYLNNHADPENIAWNANTEIMDRSHYGECVPWPLPNVWLSTSAEDQEAANERIPHLLKCPAAVRFLSCEPLLGPVDITNKGINNGYSIPTDEYKGTPIEWTDPGDNYVGVDWVIVGGESGPGARPMHPDWVRSLRDQSKEADVPFFFKQWGAWVSEFHPESSPSEMQTSNKFVTYVDRERNEVETLEEADDYYGQYMVRVGKKKAGRQLDGREWNQFPEAANDS